MAVSKAVRRYYAERIFPKMGPDKAPPNFTPLPVAPTGVASVEGCRGGGKNILEISILGAGDVLKDVRVSCGLCNPAMYVAADILADWARARPFEEVLAFDPMPIENLQAFYDALGGPGRPDDAREKFQYALLAIQRAIYDHQDLAPPVLPDVPEFTDRDWDVEWDADSEDGEDDE